MRVLKYTPDTTWSPPSFLKMVSIYNYHKRKKGRALSLGADDRMPLPGSEADAKMSGARRAVGAGRRRRRLR